MHVYVATKNAGKLRELIAIFSAYGWALETYPAYADVAEGEASYAENAALKARALRAQLVVHRIEAAVLGDDSGLEVTALNGRPGVLSARYGGPDATWAQRRERLLGEVASAGGDRRAAFVCALHFIAVDGTETAVIERFVGEIAPVERGEAGFSFDPIFTIPSLGRTFAELEEAQKNAISHRALAAHTLIDVLEAKAARSIAEKGASSGM